MSVLLRAVEPDGVEACARLHSSGYVRANVLSQDAVNQRLVSNVAAPGFCAEAVQYLRIQPDRNELPSVGSDWWPPYTGHRAKLFVRRFRKVREVNLPPPDRRPFFLCGSPAAR